MQALEVRDVTCNVEVEDLATALAGDLVGAGKPVLDEKAARGAVANAHDVSDDVLVLQNRKESIDEIPHQMLRSEADRKAR